MQLYDNRHDLIDLLENTNSDQDSLRQTLQSLTTVINILNHYEEGTTTKPVHQIHQPEKQVQPVKSPRPVPRIRQSSHSSLLTGPDHEVTPTTVKPASVRPVVKETISQEERLAADDLYLVRRKLSGAEINHRYYNEAIIHALHFPLEDGDIVQLDPQQTVRGLPAIRRVTADHIDDYEPENIKVIEYAELASVPGSDVLQINSTIKGNSILDESSANTIVIDPFKFPGRSLKAGMVIDYAYFDHGNGLEDAKNGSIRWIHEKQDFDTTKQPEKPKQVKKVTHPRHDYEKKLDYDLKQRIVLVITGDRERSQELKTVIDKHHGVYHALDASMEDKVSSSKMKREIREAEFVVVCIDKIHHRISQLANHHAKRYDKPLAIANTTTNTAVERAVARALNGDPAYAQTSEDMANYQEK